MQHPASTPYIAHQKLEKHLQKQVQRLNNDKIYCMFQVGFGSNKIQSTGIVILKNLMYCSERYLIIAGRFFLKYNLFSCTLLILENDRQFLNIHYFLKSLIQTSLLYTEYLESISCRWSVQYWKLGTWISK